MSTSAFDADLAYSRLHFEEGLMRAGFVEHESGWVGQIPRTAGAADVRVVLPQEFPFAPPRVTPIEVDAVPWSWHRETDGALCLVAEDDHENLWWTAPDAFLDHVRAWFASADSGWPNDRPDLDLDRYFPMSEDHQLYIYGELDQLRDCFVRFKPGNNETMRLAGKGTKPRRAPRGHRQSAYGYVTHIGSVRTPPRNWADLSSLMDPAMDLERKIRAHDVRVLVLLYDRSGHDATILLETWPTTGGDIAVRRLRSASDSIGALSVRSGPHSADLAESRVAVVGVGALGSFVGDVLLRAGVGEVTLIDGDVVKPGNVVRHLIGPGAVGMNKANAVKKHLVQYRGVGAERIHTETEDLAAVSDAIALVHQHDLVVNATADFAVTAMLHFAARASGRVCLSVAIQNYGRTLRIDVLPPLDGARPMQSSALPARPGDAEYFEAGCGSPISPTPPHVVIEAAGTCVRHAIGLLLGTPVSPTGEVRHMEITPGGDR